MEPQRLASLEAARAEVDRLSLALLRLLNARGRCALGIRRLKSDGGAPLRDPRREAQLIEWLVGHNDGPFDDATVRAVFRVIIDASVSLMERDAAAADPVIGPAPLR
ncbi:MAG: chorismate mutase [Sandaracinaceae bacterium]|nr:chorismate mutase [Sandaracinaceae bacterium]